MKKNKNENKKQKIEEELIEEADQEIENIDKERILQLEDHLRRALADYKNLEKRTEEKRSELVINSNMHLIQKLLPILDDLFLAQKHIQDDGLNLSIQKFLDILKDEGVRMIETKDVKFDPNIMECVSVTQGDEGKVLEELRKGFIMNDRILRPAQVVVGSGEQKN